MAAGRCASIKEITECSICLDTFKHPKGLPCLHTFCLLCLERFCKDNVNNENTRACPLCRKAFVIPEGGIQDLPNNFMIDKFMLANPSIRNAVITDKTAFCELCLDIDVKAVAIAYCLECEQHICERHLLSHKSKKQSKSHKISLFDDDDEPYAREMLVRNDQLKDNIAKIEICTLTSRIKVDAFEREKTALIAQVNVAEKEINDKFNQVLSLIKSHHNLLLDNLGTFRNEKLTTLDQRIDEEETRFHTLERFNSDVLEIDNAENVCYATSNYLHARAVKLVETQCAVKSTAPIEVDVTFVPSYFTANGFKNLIGELRFQDNTFWSGGQCQEQLRSQLSCQTANFTPNPMTLQISPGHVPCTFSIRSPTSERPTRRNMTFNTPTTMSPITINSPMRPSRPNGLSSPTTTPNSAMRPFVEVSSRSANRRFNPVARHPPLGRTINGQFQSVFGQQPLTSRILDSVPLEEQKQILGERIYPLVSLTYPDIARKITGMLLEIDNEALLLLLQSHEALKSKVEEAVTVLQAYQGRENAASHNIVS